MAVEVSGEKLYDWSRLLVDEGKYFYTSQPDANAQIENRLKRGQSSPKDVLIEIIKEYKDPTSRNDVLVLCALTRAVQLGIADQVVTGSENDVQACVKRAQTQRLRVEKNAEDLLKARWGGSDICETGQQASARLVTELAKLCRLGISREVARDRLKAQIIKRRTTRTPGLSNSPFLQPRDVHSVVALTRGEVLQLDPVPKPSPSKKRKRKDLAGDTGAGIESAQSVSMSSEPDPSSQLLRQADQNGANRGNAEPVEEQEKTRPPDSSGNFSPDSPAHTCSSPFNRHSTAPSSAPHELRSPSRTGKSNVTRRGFGKHSPASHSHIVQADSALNASPASMEEGEVLHALKMAKARPLAYVNPRKSLRYRRPTVTEVTEEKAAVDPAWPGEDILARDAVISQRPKRPKSQHATTTDRKPHHDMAPERPRQDEETTLADYDSSMRLSSFLSETRILNAEPSITPSGRDVGGDAAFGPTIRNASGSSGFNVPNNTDVEIIKSITIENIADGKLGDRSIDGQGSKCNKLLNSSNASTPSTQGLFELFPVNPEEDTQPRQIPINDPSGAISSLYPGQWLSATAIQLALEYCGADNVRIFDPSFLSATTPIYLSRGIGRERLWVIPLLLQNNHWTLITIYVISHSVDFWDSRPSLEHEAEARKAVRNLESSLNLEARKPSAEAVNIDWAFSAKSCPAQTNDNDCGIYTIMFAFFRILDQTLPKSLDPYFCRPMICSLLVGPVHWNEGCIDFDIRTPIDERPELGNKSCFHASKHLLRGDTDVSLKRLHDAELGPSLSKDIIGVLKDFLERKTVMYDKSVEKLHDLEKATVAYEAMANAFGTFELKHEDKEHLAHTQAILAKYHKQRATAEKEPAELRRAKESWKRALSLCAEEHGKREAILAKEQDDIRRLIAEHESLKDYISSLQDELGASL